MAKLNSGSGELDARRQRGWGAEVGYKNGHLLNEGGRFALGINLSV
jgi:hypothetical protein